MVISRFGVFAAGVVFATSVSMFAQDLIGMEKFLEWAEDGWVHMNPLWWVPLIATSAWFGTKVRLFLAPGDDVLLGNDGKPYKLTPMEEEGEKSD